MNKNRRYAIMILIIVFIILAAVYIISGQKEKAGFSEEEAKKEIIFDGDHIFTTRTSYVEVEGSRVTIRRGGTYTLKGRLNDGQIIIAAGEDEEVYLKLNGLSVTTDGKAALYVRKAGKVVLRLKEGSENIFSDSLDEDGSIESETAAEDDGDQEQDQAGDMENKEDKACIYARSDLKIKGKGSLLVTARNKHGIFSTKDLKISNGLITVEAASQALHGKDSILIEGGKLDLTAGTDGLHSKGDLLVSKGEVAIVASRYGMYAFDSLLVRPEAEVIVENALSEAGCHGKLSYSSSADK